MKVRRPLLLLEASQTPHTLSTETRGCSFRAAILEKAFTCASMRPANYLSQRDSPPETRQPTRLRPVCAAPGAVGGVKTTQVTRPTSQLGH